MVGKNNIKKRHELRGEKLKPTPSKNSKLEQRVF